VKLPDGRVTITRAAAAERASVSRRGIAEAIDRGEITDLTKSHGTKNVLASEVDSYKAVRDGSTVMGQYGREVDDDGQPLSQAEKRALAVMDRKTASIQKFWARWQDKAGGAFLAKGARRDLLAICTAAEHALGDWRPVFADHLTSIGNEAFAQEMADIASTLRLDLEDLITPPSGSFEHPDALDPGAEPITNHITKTAAESYLDYVKASTDRIDYYLRVGHLASRRDTLRAVEDTLTITKSKIANLYGRILPHVHVAQRSGLRAQIIEFAEGLIEILTVAVELQEIKESIRHALRPPSDLTVSEWAEEYRVLTSEASAEPGRWRNSRTSYLVEPMDACGDDQTRRVSLMLASQLGKTELINNVLAHMIAERPGPAMVMQPTVEMGAEYAKNRLSPMIATIPALKRAVEEVAEAKGKTGGAVQRQLSRSFPGGTLSIVGANSPSSLASRPIRVLLADESDRYPLSAGQEGSPVAIAERRTASFPFSKKLIIVSTPTLAGESVIERAFLAGDQRHWYAVCPHCGHAQVLDFDHIQCDEDNPEAALYLCADADCGTLWDDAERWAAVAAGSWVAHNPDAPKDHKSYTLNGLNSPFYPLAELAADMVRMRKDPMEWRSFVNTVMAQPYTDDTANVEEASITARMEPVGLDLIPEDVLAITGGVDIQGDRAELQTVGWCEDGRRFILAHERIYGDPTGHDLWHDLDEAITRKFQHALGRTIGYDAIAIDSGYQTAAVLEYCAKRSWTYAVKGVPGSDRAIWKMSKHKRRKFGQADSLHLVGVDQGKTSVMTALQREPGPGYVHIANMDEALGGVGVNVFAEQLLSEYRSVTPTKTGHLRVEWRRKPGRDAEVLDCCVYALAVRTSIKPNWTARRDNLTRLPTPHTTTPTPTTPNQTQSAPSTGGWAAFE